MNEREIRVIKLDKIDLDTAQPRGKSDEKKVIELAKDIRERGLLYPILVTPYYKQDSNLILGKNAINSPKCRWWILDGERRVRAIRINKQEGIEAIVKMDLSFLQMLEIQFASNTKRVQITVEEMARAIKRFKKEFLKTNPKGNPIKRLVELTGYSPSYFDMADAINRSSKELQEKIFTGKVGGYAAAEIERATKSAPIRRGITNVYIDSDKPISALTPRVLKKDFLKIEENKNLSDEDKEKLTEGIVRKWVSSKNEGVDENPNFLRYRYEAEEFFSLIKKWNVKRLKKEEIEELITIIDIIRNYFMEERRKVGEIRRYRATRNIGG